MFEPLTRDRLYRGIIDQITRSILTGRMRPGDHLPSEPELSEQFGVSRTVVREAIKALTMQGLVDVVPGRGTIITQPPIETVVNSLQLIIKLEDHSFDDLIEARRLLEVPIARLAARNAQAENIDALAANLEGMRSSTDDIEAFVRYDTAFHAELANATQNIVLRVLVQPIVHLLQASRETLVRVPHVAYRALDFHQHIYEAVIAHDPEAAEKSMYDHLAQAAEDIERARHYDADRANIG